MSASPSPAVPHLHVTFQTAGSIPVRMRKGAQASPPFSLRLSPEERARLEAAASGAPLGAYIRKQLLGDGVAPRRARKPAPVKDHAALAQALGLLGNLRLANNLNQLARAANIGTLPLTPEVEKELIKACAAVLAIRAEIMRALGYPSEDQP